MKEENKEKLREFLNKTKIETASKEEAIFVQDIACFAEIESANKTEKCIDALYFYIGNYRISHNTHMDSFIENPYKEVTPFDLAVFYHELEINEFTDINIEVRKEYNKMIEEIEILKNSGRQLLEIISKIATKKFLKKYKSK